MPPGIKVLDHTLVTDQRDKYLKYYKPGSLATSNKPKCFSAIRKITLAHWLDPDKTTRLHLQLIGVCYKLLPGLYQKSRPFSGHLLPHLKPVQHPPALSTHLKE